MVILKGFRDDADSMLVAFRLASKSTKSTLEVGMINYFSPNPQILLYPIEKSKVDVELAFPINVLNV